MGFIKIGEAIRINASNIQDTDTIIADSDLAIEDRMRKFAQTLKVIAPQASDFLYFTCVMMHAAEAALLDDKGEIRKHSDGKPVTATWEKVGKEGLKWVCSDKSIKPVKNKNSDIFSEHELYTEGAYKKWVGRPLCIDHKSNSPDHFRGVIVDTYYDTKKKRVIALCALDRKLYPDLARKVSTGVSTDVSMGTAVGKAICYDCGKVARVESDFCEHMRNKTTYGEINCELSPIELSIVVNGADPKAKIKTIIAKDLSDVNKAAQTLQDYLDKKISVASSNESDSFSEQIQALKDQIKTLEEKVKGSGCECAHEGCECDEHSGCDAHNCGMTDSSREMTGHGATESATLFSGPEPMPVASYASELQKLILETRVKLASIDDNLTKYLTDEETMTAKKAYFQGTEEPTPGQNKYPVDPGAAAAREADKPQGKGTGPIDGMHPGSSGESDEALKTRLQRAAEIEARAAIRKAALEKAKLESKAYFQGTEEPTPGKSTYKADPIAEQARKSEEANLTPVADDTKAKQQLQRAAMRASFTKALHKDGSINKAASAWKVFAGDQLVITATVDQITKGNSEMLFDSVATKPFGHSLLNKIKAEGFEKTRNDLTKSAQAAPPAPPPAAPAAPPADLGAPPMGDPGVDESGGGEVDAESLVTEISNLAADIGEKVVELGEIADVSKEEVDSNPSAPATEGEFEAADKAIGPVSAMQAQKMRKTIAGMLVTESISKVAELKAHLKELQLAKETFTSKFAKFDGAKKVYFKSLVSAAARDAKQSLAETKEITASYVKYASGVADMIKRAQLVNLDGLAPIVGDPYATSETMDVKVDEASNADKDMLSGTSQMLRDQENAQRAREGRPSLEEEAAANKAAAIEESRRARGDAANADVTVTVPENTPISELSKDTKLAFDLSTREGRAQYRTKIAQKGLKLNPILDQAHPQGSVTVSGIKTTGDGAKIEGLEDIHNKMYQLSQASPKAKKQAEQIHKHVVAGDISKDDVETLTAHGIDAEAVKYYKAFWGEAKDADANDFAKKLTQETATKKAAEELKVTELKIARAYELAHDMAEKSLIQRADIKKTASEIQKWNDESFNSVKAMVEKSEIRKIASVPQVGLLHSQDIIIPAKQETSTDIAAYLSARWAGVKPR